MNDIIKDSLAKPEKSFEETSYLKERGANMKIFIMMATIFFANQAFSEIVQPNDQALDEDLNFRLVEDRSKQRQIASDKESEQKKESDNETPDSERDIASDGEKESNKVQYWSY